MIDYVEEILILNLHPSSFLSVFFSQKRKASPSNPPPRAVNRKSDRHIHPWRSSARWDLPKELWPPAGIHPLMICWCMLFFSTGGSPCIENGRFFNPLFFNWLLLNQKPMPKNWWARWLVDLTFGKGSISPFVKSKIRVVESLDQPFLIRFLVVWIHSFKLPFSRTKIAIT